VLRVKLFTGSPKDIEKDFNKWSEDNTVVIHQAQWDGGSLIVFYQLPAVSKPSSGIVVPTPHLKLDK